MSKQFPDPLPKGETVVIAPSIALLLTPPLLGQICALQYFTNVRHQGGDGNFQGLIYGTVSHRPVPAVECSLVDIGLSSS